MQGNYRQGNHMQGDHRLGHSWASTTLQPRHGLATSGSGLSRWASAVGRHARSKVPLAALHRGVQGVHGRSYVGVTGSLTSRGVIS